MLVVAGLVVLITLTFGGYKARRIYLLAMSIREDISQLQGSSTSPLDLKMIMELGPLLSKTRQDFDAFSDEVNPVLWIGPWFSWIPVYGGDLASSHELLTLADLILEGTETGYTASQPLLLALHDNADLNPAQVISLLNHAQPGLIRARHTFGQAMQIRAGLDLEHLSPQTRSFVEQDFDKLMPIIDDGLSIATALPRFLGASDGPKTYLLLVQNEDELRPTGGFITAIGKLVVQNGKILRITFTDSGELDNWNYPYPVAPWQLSRYMNSPVLVLRDANWFTDFPTSALYVKSLYAYNDPDPVDGVIAFDQHMLVLILEALGPLNVQGSSNSIDAGNVIAFMRSAKSPPINQPMITEWSRKSFIDKLARAVLTKIYQGKDIPWERLGNALFQGLSEDHLLLQFDDPTLTTVIARHGWDGALHYEGGDYLLVVDSNIGFNKTNAVVDMSIFYDVDLTDLVDPIATLTVIHRNNAFTNTACTQWSFQIVKGEEYYPINACYWNYMRVYFPKGTQLLDATPQNVSAAWMISNHRVAGQVDVLDEEAGGFQPFGTLMVIPGGKSLITSFHFRLPSHILRMDGHEVTYHLKVKKQPGIVTIPLTIRIHFPKVVSIRSAYPDAIVDRDHLFLEKDLRTDLDLDINFVPK